MKFSLRRKVDALTLDEIDYEIDEHQARAEALVQELSKTLEEQGKLWRQLKTMEADDDGGASPADS